MRKKPIIKLVTAMFLLLTIAACKSKKKQDHHDLGKVEVDSALAALINPTNEKIVANLGTVQAQEHAGAKLVEVQGVVNYDSRNDFTISTRVAGRIERLYIKYNYQPVKKGQLIMEIYAPDLAAAQQDLLYLARTNNDGGLLEKAKQRLLLAGMTLGSINQVLRTKKVNYRVPVYSSIDGFIVENDVVTPKVATAQKVDNGGMAEMGMSEPVNTTSTVQQTALNKPMAILEGQYVNIGQALFKVYTANSLVAEFAIKPSLLPFVKKGTDLALYNAADKENSFKTATVSLLQPLLKNNEAFSIAKVFLPSKSFRVGEILVAKIPVVLPKSYWLPASAIIKQGDKGLLFKKQNGVFEPRKVKIGLTLNSEIQVLENIANWQVAQQASYLVDSESFLHAK